MTAKLGVISCINKFYVGTQAFIRGVFITSATSLGVASEFSFASDIGLTLPWPR